MTLGSPFPPSTTATQVRFSRRVSSLNMSADDDSGPEDNAPIIHRPSLRRQVSNEAISVSGSEDDGALKKAPPGRASPIRCVSEFDKVQAESNLKMECEVCESKTVANPLLGAKLLDQHKRALRLEAELQPMRLILSRLMAHPTMNRKGLFNKPVDPVALGLPDYFEVITKPMDFGTVKAKLHALAYKSRRDSFDDICLVLHNAMKYNPPENFVHTSARDLLDFFDDQLQAFVPELAGFDRAAKHPAKHAATSPGGASGTVQQPHVHTQGTRLSAASPALTAPVTVSSRKRKKRGSRSTAGHDCHSCEGRTCSICYQGCLHLEPALLICNGFNCAGARIRKGAVYYVAPDGSRQYCQKCYVGLPPVLPSSKHGNICRYKVSLLKRKNDEEVVESWLTCVKCQTGVHAMCVMHNESVEPKDDFKCPDCRSMDDVVEPNVSCPETVEDAFTYLTGEEVPVPASEVPNTQAHDMSADSLPETEESAFLQRKIRERMHSANVANSEKTVVVRIVSDCDRSFAVPDVVRKHFQMPTDESNAPLAPPIKVNYRSKAIALFQKIDGLDVCIFCMYVQEYDGNDEYEQPGYDKLVDSKKRVYIAYIDSVEHFRPRSCRTDVFQEILVSYLASARKRGYESAHIWACPPSRGNSFVFWNHPASQRTPTSERLVAWYHGALSRAIDCGVVTDVKSLYESGFQEHLEPLAGDSDAIMQGKMQCPPLLDGDYWIEEAVRVHDVHFSRQLKTKPDGTAPPQAFTEGKLKCPALEVAAMIRDRIISHPSSLAFRRPVNAVQLKLLDYHKVITTPMDLGTVYSRLVLGEYDFLSEVVDDVQLVFANAKRYNPKGHIVHEMAVDVSNLFFVELDSLLASWADPAALVVAEPTWKSFVDLSMNLDVTLVPSEDQPTSSPVDPVLLVSERPVFKTCAVTESTGNDLSSSSDRPPTRAELVNGGADAVHHRMVGNDTWMLDKRAPTPSKPLSASKKNSNRRKKDPIDETPSKRRRQSWLAEEVGSAVRRGRTSFFYCCLTPAKGRSVSEDEKVDTFDSYSSSFAGTSDISLRNSSIADVRHALLEFSQFRNLEFDTLRHAKYSSAILLYHLHHVGAPGVVPICSSCEGCIHRVRWHRISRVCERRRVAKRPSFAGKQLRPKKPYQPEELCASCHSSHPDQDDFIPFQVSLNA